jgi:hypothetical protein
LGYPLCNTSGLGLFLCDERTDIRDIQNGDDRSLHDHWVGAAVGLQKLQDSNV